MPSALPLAIQPLIGASLGITMGTIHVLENLEIRPLPERLKTVGGARTADGVRRWCASRGTSHRFSNGIGSVPEFLNLVVTDLPNWIAPFDNKMPKIENSD